MTVLELDFAFRHHLRNTIILLGGKKEIADLLNASQDLAVTERNVDVLRQYNIDLCDEIKTRLENQNKMVISNHPTS